MTLTILKQRPILLLLGMFLLSTFTLPLIFGSTIAHGLSCELDNRDPATQIAEAQVAFTGTLISTTGPSGSQSELRDSIKHEVKVKDVIRGTNTGDSETVHSNSTWGSSELERNKLYLFLLSEHEGELHESLCQVSILNIEDQANESWLRAVSSALNEKRTSTQLPTATFSSEDPTTQGSREGESQKQAEPQKSSQLLLFGTTTTLLAGFTIAFITLRRKS